MQVLSILIDYSSKDNDFIQVMKVISMSKTSCDVMSYTPIPIKGAYLYHLPWRWVKDSLYLYKIIIIGL
jgi:hypothetical protein